ncbi:Imm8 family immunity protein [Sphingomonas sp. RS2018]
MRHWWPGRRECPLTTISGRSDLNSASPKAHRRQTPSCGHSRMPRQGRMNAALRALMTIDHEPLDSVRPEGVAFCVSLRALVGPAGLPGEESFDFDVCSPEWLAAELDGRAIISGRFLLIARRYDPCRIEDYVRTRVAQASGDDWPTVAGKLARWSHWEFDDYRP